MIGLTFEFFQVKFMLFLLLVIMFKAELKNYLFKFKGLF